MVEFTFLHGSQFLSDFNLTILERGSDGEKPTPSATLPVHAAVLCATSNYYRTMLSSWHEPGSNDLSLVVDEGSAAACGILIFYLYSGSLPDCLDQATVMKILQLADYLQCPGAIASCLRLLSEMADLDWETAAAILALPDGFALSAGTSISNLITTSTTPCGGGGGHFNGGDKRTGGEGGGGGGPLATANQPHLQYYERAVSIAQRKVLAELGDLEAAWRDPSRQSRFLALPATAVAHLLTHPATAVASENTVLIALAAWVSVRTYCPESSSSSSYCGNSSSAAAADQATGSQGRSSEDEASPTPPSSTAKVSAAATGRTVGVSEGDMDMLFGLVRLQHLTASFLAGVAPQIDWFWSRLLCGCKQGGGVGTSSTAARTAGGSAASVSTAGGSGGTASASPLRQLLCHLRAAKAGVHTAAAFAGRQGQAVLRVGPRPRSSSAAELHFTWELEMSAVHAAIAEVRATKERRNLRSQSHFFCGYSCALALNLHAISSALDEADLSGGTDGSMIAAVAAPPQADYKAFLGILIDTVKDGGLQLQSDDSVMVAIVRGSVTCQRATPPGSDSPNPPEPRKTPYVLEGPTLGGSWGIMDFFGLEPSGEASWSKYAIGGRLFMRCTLLGLE